jgi:RecG-like helicase
MRAVLSAAIALAFVFALVVGVQGEEKKSKEVTLKGKITCSKCECKKTEACHTVIVVKKGKTVNLYYFDADSNKQYHKDICKKGKPGTVKGTVSEEDGKKIITVSKLDYDK